MVLLASSSRWSRDSGAEELGVTVLTRRLLLVLVSTAALGGCANALVTKDDEFSKVALASPPASPASGSPSDFGSSAPHWFGFGGP